MTKEKPRLAFIRKGNSLVPEMDMDRDALEAIAQGERVRVEIKQWRNSDRHRLYWSMLSKVVKATECAPNAEALHDAIKIDLGYGTPVRLKNGMKILVPGSTAFDKMDEQTFREFFDRAVKYIAENLGIDPLAFYEAA